jgi:hypothetical protein
LLTQDHPLRSPIITARQRPEPLLARRVPYRELVPLPVHLECLHFEVDADGRGGFVLGEKVVVREPEEEGGLAWRDAWGVSGVDEVAGLPGMRKSDETSGSGRDPGDQQMVDQWRWETGGWPD